MQGFERRDGASRLVIPTQVSWSEAPNQLRLGLLSGANVLVDLDCHAKLSDFGCSKRSNDTMPPPQSPPSPQSGRMWQGLVGCMLARGPRVKVLHITMGGLPFSVRVLSPIRDAGPLRGAPLKRQEAEDTTSWSWVCAMMPSGRLSPRFHLRRGRG